MDPPSILRKLPGVQTTSRSTAAAFRHQAHVVVFDRGIEFIIYSHSEFSRPPGRAGENVYGWVIMPRSVTLSFELLETVVALIRAGGEASSAMKSLKINQPTLSKRLKYLQHSGPLLERPWVERKGKTWVLTEDAQVSRAPLSNAHSTESGMT